jgi:hypothetical protein
MEIACTKSTVWTTVPPVRMREAFIWKLLAVDVRPSKRQGTIVRTWLISGKIFSKIFGISVAQLSVLTAYDFCSDDTQFLSSQMLI